MKTNQIPDIYIEQYLLGELNENIRKEIDRLIPESPELNERITRVKESNDYILSLYPAESMTDQIIKKSKTLSEHVTETEKNSLPVKQSENPGIMDSPTDFFKNIFRQIRFITARRYTLSIASAAAFVLVMVFMIPGIIPTDRFKTDSGNDVRIKGLDSKLLLYRMKGKDIEELTNFNTAHTGDILQVGYIATGNYSHGIILSIDGRGTVTLHLPDSTVPDDKLVMNRKILLNKSYELDDSPSFERFIMILSPDPINTEDIMEKAKKLAISRENAINGSIITGKDSLEFSIMIKKAQ